MLWSAIDSLGIYFWLDINLKEISFILLPWTFFGFFLPAIEERKAAKALLFTCHFSLTGIILFFCRFFGRRLAVLPSIELAPIFEHMNELYTISSWIFRGRKPRELTATLCPEHWITAFLLKFYQSHKNKKVQRDAIYRKMESSKLSQSKRNLKLTSIAKSTNSNIKKLRGNSLLLLSGCKSC